MDVSVSNLDKKGHLNHFFVMRNAEFHVSMRPTGGAPGTAPLFRSGFKLNVRLKTIVRPSCDLVSAEASQR